MADTRISNLAAGTAAPGDEIPVNRGGTNFKITAGDILKQNSGTLTASAPALDLTQTWNASGVTFTGLKFNATDTASASGSLLMDLQVGGASRFSVRKDGYTVLSAALFNVGSKVGVGIGAGTAGFLQVVSDQGLVWSSTTNVSSTVDLFLTRKAAANLQLGAADAAAPVAQTLGVQSVVAGTSNTAGANFTIRGSQGTGTGAGGSLLFQVAPAGSSGTSQNSLVTFLEATSARAFNLYNTADVTTNYERGKVAWESNALRIGTEKGGTGTARALELQTDGTTRLTIASAGLATFTGNQYWIHDSANATLVQRGSASGSPQLLFQQSTTTRGSITYNHAASALYICTGAGEPGTVRLAFGLSGGITVSDAENIAVGTTTGTKIGTATSQKLAFWNATPIVQPTTAIAEATFVENSGGTAINVDSTFDGYTLQQIAKALRDAGLLA